MQAIIVGDPSADNLSTDQVIVIRETEMAGFKETLKRATAHWQDAPPEILLLKRKLCGDPILAKWPNPADFNFLATPDPKPTQS